MVLARLMTRRRGTSVVPVVLLGAAVSLGVVAVTASRLAWRKTRSEEPAEEEAPGETANEPPRFKPAPPRDPNTPRWDTPPPSLEPATTTASPDPPSP
jgi:hypothetical protein